ncbi:putative phosphonate transport system ATP-binding protein [Cyclobacterium xiamenense]|uniref:Putative phosphonate transport system ATP-binding protein n=1 Tax=Cyclobacterium xiamenense TaxID=1297121 RepID=A0A1H6TQJ3_9BACT|nr:ATP-binding cassette domain-containing protein [Cyclobacterium xiamenense]SEI79487.1 putative phosphonate transport system ATP-binding protein [Cyclobacterium xiamenense]
MNENNWLLRVQNLTKVYGPYRPGCLQKTGPAFHTNICPDTGSIVACAHINFDIYPGEVLGIVGESGSGKSTVVQQLYFDLEASEGEVFLSKYQSGTTNLLTEPNDKKRYIRNHLLGMVYQNPRDGLNFRFSSGGNIAEKLLMAGVFHVGKIRERASELLDRTEVPLQRMDDAPANFSGGMQQRVQIAKAMANNPPLLLLDEVTTGLDVSIQAKVLDLIREIQRDLHISMVVVSHDLGVIRMLTNRTLVMKNGRIVEHGLTDQILEDPQHPYTQLLVSSLL